MDMTTDDPATILVVEDDDAPRTFLADNLSADGYDLLVADSAAVGLSLIERKFPDLALVVRISGGAVVWSRGFGETRTAQFLTGITTSQDGSIYVTGAFNGAIPLGNGEELAASSADTQALAGFLIVLNPRGNVVAASELEGAGETYVWASAPGPASSGSLYLGGMLYGTADVGLDRPLAAEGRSGFVAQLVGVP